MQRPLESHAPDVAESAFVSEMAYLVGDVTVAERASVWPFVCMRGDYGAISVGAETNVQDFTMLHEATVGSGVTIGHNVIVDRATVGDDALLGMSSTVLPGASVGDDCIVAAGTVVREDQAIPDGHIAYGSPPELKPITEEQRDDIRWYCEEYLQLADRYRQADAPLDSGEETTQ
jgi:carbonic anhydrase/acetyltransferase-like protein (isoleucine patch superfamily)